MVELRDCLRTCTNVRPDFAICTHLRDQSPASAGFALRQDLVTMRAIISQYTLDKHKPPLSLDDLVAAGYLKEVPTDPMTGRKDTWVVMCSSDRSLHGIVGIDSGYGNADNKRTLRRDW